MISEKNADDTMDLWHINYL